VFQIAGDHACPRDRGSCDRGAGDSIAWTNSASRAAEIASGSRNTRPPANSIASAPPPLGKPVTTAGTNAGSVRPAADAERFADAIRAAGAAFASSRSAITRRQK